MLHRTTLLQSKRGNIAEVAPELDDVSFLCRAMWRIWWGGISIGASAGTLRPLRFGMTCFTERQTGKRARLDTVRGRGGCGDLSRDHSDDLGWGFDAWGGLEKRWSARLWSRVMITDMKLHIESVQQHINEPLDSVNNCKMVYNDAPVWLELTRYTEPFLWQCGHCTLHLVDHLAKCKPHLIPAISLIWRTSTHNSDTSSETYQPLAMVYTVSFTQSYPSHHALTRHSAR